jgi:hypothetical protein
VSLRPDLLIAALTILLAGCDSACGNRPVRSFPSPDGLLRAVLFERDCGATTGTSSQISLVGRRENVPDDGGNLFVADDDHGTAKSGESGSVRVAVRWLDAHRLEISYDRLARVFKAERHLRDVEISYVAD